MKLSECVIGTIIKSKCEGLIGSVVKITQNSCKEAIPLVQWQDGSEYPVHPSNIEKYED